MDHSQHGRPADFVFNHPHQHALVVLGDTHLFAVHMTQYHHEEHKYQLVLRISLPPEAKSRLDHAREMYPRDTFVLCNDDAEDALFVIPDLPSGRRKTFRGNIFQGLPPFTEEDEANPHFFPWDKARVKPLIADVEVTIERILAFYPFAHHLNQPDYATYLLWGEGDEAHMTSLQTAALASDKFEAPRFGPDFDHVMTLKQAPPWLDKSLLEAGVVVSVPDLRLSNPVTGKKTIPTDVPFAVGDPITVLYRGMGEGHQVTAGPTFLADSAVCNSPGVVAEPALIISATPKEQLL